MVQVIPHFFHNSLRAAHSTAACRLLVGANPAITQTELAIQAERLVGCLLSIPAATCQLLPWRRWSAHWPPR
jgi:hypothetical protein